VRLIDKLRNLLSLAAADGTLSEREIRFLSARVVKWGIPEHEFAEAVEFALAHRGELTLPRGHEAGLDLLREMVQMMAADGELTESEKRMFATAAAHLNVSQSEIDRMIDGLVDDQAQRDAE
jgi:uncharacterized tellurite resistance protein B-like protein